MRPPDGTINPTKIESPGGAVEQQQQQGPPQQPSYSSAPLFDPSDPALFNFDIASLNFGSHYGALEFGMLGQMSSTQGAHGRSTSENGTSNPNSTYGYSPGVGNTANDNYIGFSAPQDTETQWTTTHRGSRDDSRSGFANTYMIEAGPGSLTSPSPPVESPRAYNTTLPSSSTQPQPSQAPSSYTDQTSPAASPNFFPSTRPTPLQQVHSASSQPYQQHHPFHHPQHHPPQPPPQPQPLRRRRIEDPSSIYSSIKDPYPYALQHHRLFHMLETRFPKPLLLRIARAMASFRPSFIACTQALAAADLVFMEKCFQRTLWEYERFIQSCGTPTIVCRRTGEVVGVGKEFCMLTGWDRNVLLGEKLNRNVNPAWVRSQTQALAAGGGLGPQHHSYAQQQAQKQQQQQHTGAVGALMPPPPADDDIKRPVFLAELLDDDSVVEFYEEFARLAFGDSRGAVTTTCSVFTYKPGEELGEGGGGGVKTEGGGGRVGGGGGQGAGVVNRATNLAGKDGKVECAFCWTIKRDVFDIPMLIVGNVSMPRRRVG